MWIIDPDTKLIVAWVLTASTTLAMFMCFIRMHAVEKRLRLSPMLAGLGWTVLSARLWIGHVLPDAAASIPVPSVIALLLLGASSITNSYNVANGEPDHGGV